jgi:TIR domain
MASGDIVVSPPFNKRPNDVFVSYSHADSAQVEPLVRWLQDVAGLGVWYDARRLAAGDRLAAALPTGLASARAALFCVSRSWNGSTWCEDEYNAALQERRANRLYRVIALRLDDCKVPAFLSNARYLEMQTLDTEVAADLLQALVPDPAPWSQGQRDVYLSRSWHVADAETADRVCLALARDYGFRLIGDSPEYPAFDADTRVKRIIESCGALVAVLPFRDDAANGFTSKWIVREVQLARDLSCPYVLFAADGVRLDATLTAAAIGARTFPLPTSADDQALAQTLDLLEENYHPSPRPAYSFFATSLRSDVRETDRTIAVIEQITGMQCLLGQRLQGQHAQLEIIERIKNAQFVLADISANHANSLIEAGIARGAGTRLHLICRPPDSGELQTRFMFRDLEVNWYHDALERIGTAHQIARLYRRRVFDPTAGGASRE